MSTNDAHSERAALRSESDREPAPDMLAELGPLAYGLLILSETGPLTEIRALTDSQGAQIPAQSGHVLQSDRARQEALLGELGRLDL